jgi:hypothetical protein
MKIKSIQTNQDVYFLVVPNSPCINHVDEIQSNWVDSEQEFDIGCIKGYKQKIAYQGYKNGKLVFEMFNPDLITYETTED